MSRENESGWLERVTEISFISLIFHPVMLMICLMTAVVMVAIILWNTFYETIAMPSDVYLDSEIIHISPVPDWIKIDIKRAAIFESRLDEVKLSQADAVTRVADALGVQGWVKTVNQVRKSSRGVKVDLLYRRPVAIVEVAPEGFFPIDAEAVVLDGQGYTSEDTSSYWRISVPSSLTEALSFGRTWNDLRVIDAAAIAAYLDSQRSQTGLIRIVNYAQPTRDRLRMQPFQLWTSRGTRVIWGSAPGNESANEAAADEKISAIVQFIESQGPLDQQSTQFFDVRSGTVRPTTAEVAKEDHDFLRLN